jgi:glutathione S-transferase
MTEFIVHSVPGSPFGRTVLAALEEKRADYRLAALAPGMLKIEPHVSRHPFGRVPVLEHDGFVLYETQAILRYLDRALPAPALTPAELRAAARMDQPMNINDWYLFQGVNSVIGFQRVIGHRLFGLAPDEAAIAAVMPKARVTFGCHDCSAGSPISPARACRSPTS